MNLPSNLTELEWLLHVLAARSVSFDGFTFCLPRTVIFTNAQPQHQFVSIKNDLRLH
jgi:hypothetical protein